MRGLIVALIALSQAGCAGLDRMNEYGSRLADAKTTVDGREFSLWVHPRDNAILVQRGFGAAMGQSVAEGLTLNSVQMTEPKPFWRRAAEWLAAPVGCQVTDVYTLDNNITWEAPYTCPVAVDLREKVTAQREALRRGEPLKP